MANLTQELIRKVNDLTTVVNSMINNAKWMEELPNASLPLSDIDLIRIVQDGIDKKALMSEVGGSGNALDRMRWKNIWVNAAYIKFDVVVDGSWTMVANKDTTERAAPQPVGISFYVYEDIIGSAQNTEKQIIYGQSYTNPVNAWLLTGYRVWTVVGQRYEIYSITGRATPDEVITQLISFTANAGGWTHFGINNILIAVGFEFDLIVIVKEGAPVETNTNANYDYDTPGGGGDIPGTGQIIHNNNDLDHLLIHKTDNDGTDRSALLASYTNGDTISDGSVTWTVQNNIDSGAYHTMTVLPSQQTSDGVKTFVFSQITPAPITYAYDQDEWLGEPNIRGLFDPGITPGVQSIDNIQENDNQYGIDLQIQEVTISQDWDWLNPGAGGNSSSPGATDPIEIVDNLTTQDATKALSANQGYVLDQGKSPVGHTHPNPFGKVIETSADYNTSTQPTESGVTNVMKAPATKITLDSTNMTPGWYQQAVNNIGGTLTIQKAPTDLVVGLLPGYIPDTQMVFYQLIAPGLWVVAYGDEVAAHALKDHIDVTLPDNPIPNARLAYNIFNGQWEEKETLSGLGITEFSYSFQLPASITPLAGFVSRGSDNPTTTIRLYFNANDVGGFDKGSLLSQIKATDTITFINQNNIADTEVYKAIFPPFLNPVDNVWILDIEHVTSTGTVLQDNATLNVQWRIVPEEVLQVAIVLQEDGAAPGYVTSERDNTKMGPVGINALDVSWSDGAVDNDQGAKGESSLAIGLNVKASGWSAIGLGYLIRVLGDLAFVHGYDNEASGYAAFMTGFDNISNGDYTFTHGVSNVNNTNRGTMIGQGLLGNNVTGAIILGQCNIEPPVDNVLFIIGNGSIQDGANNIVTRLTPSNALTVYKSGLVEIYTDPTTDKGLGNRGYNDLRYSFKNVNLLTDGGFDVPGNPDWQLTGGYQIVNNALVCGPASGIATYINYNVAINTNYMIEVIISNYVSGTIAFKLNGKITRYVLGNGKWIIPAYSGDDTIIWPGLMLGDFGNVTFNGTVELVQFTLDPLDAGYKEVQGRHSWSGSIVVTPEPQSFTDLLHNDTDGATVTLEQDPTFNYNRMKRQEFIQNKPGKYTFIAGAGVTINSLNGFRTAGQYGRVLAEWVAADIVVISGDLIA